MEMGKTKSNSALNDLIQELNTTVADGAIEAIGSGFLSWISTTRHYVKSRYLVAVVLL